MEPVHPRAATPSVVAWPELAMALPDAVVRVRRNTSALLPMALLFGATVAAAAVAWVLTTRRDFGRMGGLMGGLLFAGMVVALLAAPAVAGIGGLDD